MVKPIIPPATTEKYELDALEYINHTCHNTPRDTTSEEYIIKIPRFDSGTLEEWIIFVDLVQKSLAQQNSTAGPLMYKRIKRVLKGDTKDKFLKMANLVRSWSVSYFTTVMVNIWLYMSPLSTLIVINIYTCKGIKGSSLTWKYRLYN